jgi:hypothetical protein
MAILRRLLLFALIAAAPATLPEANRPFAAEVSRTEVASPEPAAALDRTRTTTDYAATSSDPASPETAHRTAATRLYLRHAALLL